MDCAWSNYRGSNKAVYHVIMETMAHTTTHAHWVTVWRLEESLLPLKVWKCILGWSLAPYFGAAEEKAKRLCKKEHFYARGSFCSTCHTWFLSASKKGRNIRSILSQSSYICRKSVCVTTIAKISKGPKIIRWQSTTPFKHQSSRSICIMIS